MPARSRCVEWLFDLSLTDRYWKMFSIVIQLGAILSLALFFRTRIGGLLATFPRGERGDRGAVTHPLTLILVAFTATAVPALLLAKTIGHHLESLRIMGGALLVGGVVMWIDELGAHADVGAVRDLPHRAGHARARRGEAMGQLNERAFRRGISVGTPRTATQAPWPHVRGVIACWLPARQTGSPGVPSRAGTRFASRRRHGAPAASSCRAGTDRAPGCPSRCA